MQLHPVACIFSHCRTALSQVIGWRESELVVSVRGAVFRRRNSLYQLLLLLLTLKLWSVATVSEVA